MDFQLMTLLGLGVLAAAAGIAYRRFRSRNLPDVPADEFLKSLAVPQGVEVATILKERARVARIIGVPPEKLAPSHTFEGLSKSFEYLGEFSVAWTDLEDEAEDLRRELGMKKEAEPLATVGDYIVFVTWARAKIGGKTR